MKVVIYEMENHNIIEKLREPIKHEFIGGEKEFEENVLANIKEICEGLNLPEIKYTKSQQKIVLKNNQIIIDILVTHIDDSASIFEVKKAPKKHPSTGTSSQVNAIGQLLLYRNVFKIQTGITPRLFLIDNKIYERTYWVYLENELPVTLVQLQKDEVFAPYVTRELMKMHV